jgi:Exocyst complex component Sec10
VQHSFDHRIVCQTLRLPVQRDVWVTESTQALEQLGQVLEKSIESALEAALEGVEGLIARTLAAEQRRTDFTPAAGDSDKLDRPTAACQLVVALVKALWLDAEEGLRAEPAHAFLNEVWFSFPDCCACSIDVYHMAAS